MSKRRSPKKRTGARSSRRSPSTKKPAGEKSVRDVKPNFEDVTKVLTYQANEKLDSPFEVQQLARHLDTTPKHLRALVRQYQHHYPEGIPEEVLQEAGDLRCLECPSYRLQPYDAALSLKRDCCVVCLSKSKPLPHPGFLVLPTATLPPDPFDEGGISPAAPGNCPSSRNPWASDDWDFFE